MVGHQEKWRPRTEGTWTGRSSDGFRNNFNGRWTDGNKEQGTRQEQGAGYTRKERAPWLGSGESGESQRWQQSMSGNRKEWDHQQSPECGHPGVLGKGEREEETLPRQYMGTAGGGVNMGLPKIDRRAGPRGWQLEPPWGVHSQTAAGYGQWVGGLGPNTAPLGSQGGWAGRPGAQGG